MYPVVNAIKKNRRSKRSHMNKYLKRLKIFLDKEGLRKESNSLQNIIKMAAEKDAKELIKINLKEISKNKTKEPTQDPKDFYAMLREEAEEGPIFSYRTIEYIKQLQEQNIPRGNRKGFVKWLANQINNDLPPQQQEVRYITDWLNGMNWPQEFNLNLDELSYNEALQASRTWHDSFKQQNQEQKEYQNIQEVYSFDNGYTIVKVPPEDLEAEGDMMGHCVGGYCDEVKNNKIEIYSLRDPNKKPHVTIEVRELRGGWDDKEVIKEVEQIKGKENKIPIGKYSEMIRDFLKNTDWEYSETEDFIDLPPEKAKTIEMMEKKDYKWLFDNHAQVGWPKIVTEEMANTFWILITDNLSFLSYWKPTEQIVKKADINNIFDFLVTNHEKLEHLGINIYNSIVMYTPEEFLVSLSKDYPEIFDSMFKGGEGINSYSAILEHNFENIFLVEQRIKMLEKENDSWQYDDNIYELKERIKQTLRHDNISRFKNIEKVMPHLEKNYAKELLANEVVEEDTKRKIIKNYENNSLGDSHYHHEFLIELFDKQINKYVTFKRYDAPLNVFFEELKTSEEIIKIIGEKVNEESYEEKASALHKITLYLGRWKENLIEGLKKTHANNHFKQVFKSVRHLSNEEIEAIITKKYDDFYLFARKEILND